MIALDLRGLRREWYEDEGEVRFLLEAPADTAPTRRRLAETSAAVTAALSPTNPVVAEQWLWTSAGWSGVLTCAFSFDHAVDWLEQLAIALGDDVEGVLQAAPRGRMPRGRDARDQLTTFAYWRTEDLRALPPAQRDGRWAVDPALTPAVFARAVEWIEQVDAPATLSRPGPWYVELAGDVDAGQPAAIGEAARRYLVIFLRAATRRAFVERTLGTRQHGLLALQLVDESLSALERAALLTESFAWDPAALDYAYLTHCQGGTPIEYGLLWPHVSEPDVRYNRPLLASYVPDAFGVQLLTAAHLERAHDLSRWRVEQVAPERYLVSAVDLEPWVSRQERDPHRPHDVAPRPTDGQEQARADFGAMILTPETIRADDPWR